MGDRDFVQVSSKFRVTGESHCANNAESRGRVRAKLVRERADAQEEVIAGVFDEWPNQLVLFRRKSGDPLAPAGNRYARFRLPLLAGHRGGTASTKLESLSTNLSQL